MTDYKKDFLDHMDNKVKANLESEKLYKEKAKANLELYYKVVSNEFVKEVKDVVKTVNSKLKYFKARFEDNGMIYNQAEFILASTLEPNSKSLGGFIVLKLEDNFITMSSRHFVLEQLNDLGDYEDSNIIGLPQKRGKKTLDEEDIKEAREQFIRGAYRLAKEFN